jgi:hypothetical protein
VGSEWRGARVGIGGDGVCAGLGAGVIDATLAAPSRELSLSMFMPSAGEAMLQYYRLTGRRARLYSP